MPRVCTKIHRLKKLQHWCVRTALAGPACTGQPSTPDWPAPRARARLQLRRRLAVCCCVLRQYRTRDTHNGARGAFQYWFCCCVECCRYSNWHQNEMTNRPYGDDRAKVVSEEELDKRDAEMVMRMERELRVAAAILPPLSLST